MRLLKKFEAFGVRNPLLQWIEIYYTGRKAQCSVSLIFCAEILRFFRQREIDLCS
jgi:hypothetical protein